MRIVRLISAALVLGGLAWSGWWYALATGQRTALAAWFEQRREAGWQAEFGDAEVTGFPFRILREVDGIHLADPRAGWAWTAPRLRIDSATFSPNRVEVTWPRSQTLAVPGEHAAVAAESLVTGLALRPDTALELIDARIEAAGLDIRGQSGWTAKAGRVSASVVSHVNDAGYEMSLIAEKLLLPEPLLAQIDPLGVAGRELERLVYDGSTLFDGPLDRHVVEDGRLALRGATIRRAALQWGEMRLEAQGQIKVDEQGYPDGKLDVTAKHWREMVALARQSGAIGPEIADALVSALELVAMIGGKRDQLDVTLTFRDGGIRIGPVSIGRAPRLAPPRGKE